jgi:hypothetical protein
MLGSFTIESKLQEAERARLPLTLTRLPMSDVADTRALRRRSLKPCAVNLPNSVIAAAIYPM